jgi:hypothetical protein
VALRRRVLGLMSSRLRAVLGALQWSELHLHVRLGLDDPADTGCLWAFMGPLGAGLTSLRAVELTIEPDFIEATLDIDARGRLVLVPLQLLWSLLMLAAALGVVAARQRMARGSP